MSRRTGIAAVAFAVLAVCGGIAVRHFWFRAPDAEPIPVERFQRALSQVRRGEGLADAFKLARSLGEIPELKQHAALLRGGVELRSGEIDRAYRTLSGLKPPPDIEPEARVMMGECLYRLGRHSEAAMCLRPLFNIPRVAADAHSRLAAIQYDLGNNTESLRHLDELIRIESEDHRPHLLAARMHADFKQHDLAAEHFAQALRKAPPGANLSEIAAGYAGQLIEMERFQAGLDALRGIPESAETLAMQAKALWALNNRPDADSAAAKALVLDPDQPEALLVRAEQALADGRANAAVELLERLVARHPIHYEGRYRLSVAYRENGQVNEAKRTFEEVQQLNLLLDRLNVLNNRLLGDPDNIPLRREIAGVWRELGNEQMATTWDKAAAAAEEFTTGQ